jgi:hypothetical protein
MTQMGYGFSAEGHKRNLKLAICRGYYGSISSVVIEVEGSPVRGRAIVWSHADFSKSPYNIFSITVQNKKGRFRTYDKRYYEKNGSGIISKILNLAISEANK